MASNLLFLGQVFLLVSLVKTIPIFKTQNSDFESTVELCKNIAIGLSLNEQAKQIRDFRLDMRKSDFPFDMRLGQDKADFADDFESDILTRTLQEREQLGTNNGDTDNVYDDVNLAFEKCLKDYISEESSAQSKQELSEALSQFSNDIKVANSDFKSFLSSQDFESPAKRSRALSLNPTGWRKRRSDPDDEERLKRFMRNMHELFEKRQRLQFNPTGW